MRIEGMKYKGDRCVCGEHEVYVGEHHSEYADGSKHGPHLCLSPDGMVLAQEKKEG